MEEIKQILEKDNFFTNKNYQIVQIQKWNKNTQFLLLMDNKKYTLILGEKNIQKIKNRLNSLDEYYKEFVGLKYLNDSLNIALLDYYENGSGVPLSKLSLSEEENIYIAEQLKKIMDNMHSHKRKFVCLSTHFKGENWYDFIHFYMNLYAQIVLEQKDISKEEYNFIFNILEKNKNYFLSISLNYLHGDVNEDNICYDAKRKKVYLIDYDDCLIGDTLYDYARLFQYTHIPSIKIIKEKYFKNIEKNEIFLIYYLRNIMLDYCFRKVNKMDATSLVNSIHRVLEKIKELNDVDG